MRNEAYENGNKIGYTQTSAMLTELKKQKKFICVRVQQLLLIFLLKVYFVQIRTLALILNLRGINNGWWMGKTD